MRQATRELGLLHNESACEPQSIHKALLCGLLSHIGMKDGEKHEFIGARNARFVLNYLQTDNIPVLVEDLLDIYPRKICFFPHSGKVMVRKLKQNLDNAVLTTEREYQKRLGATLKQAPVSGGDIDLF